MSWISRSLCFVCIFLHSAIPVVSSEGNPEPQDLMNMPRFLESPVSYHVQVGQEARLTCTVENLGAKQRVNWRRASSQTFLTLGLMKYSEDPRISSENRGQHWRLKITDVQLDDTGVYECMISSKMKHLRHHVTLVVSEPELKPDIHISGTTYVDEGERLVLTCVARSKDYPPEDIDWFRSGNTLETNKSRGQFIEKTVSLVEGTINSVLRIDQARMEDAGVYVCRSSNTHVVSTMVNVLKTGKDTNKKRGTEKGSLTSYKTTSTSSSNLPSPPYLTVLLISSLSVVFTWHRPTSLELT